MYEGGDEDDGDICKKQDAGKGTDDVDVEIIEDIVAVETEGKEKQAVEMEDMPKEKEESDKEKAEEDKLK